MKAKQVSDNNLEIIINTKGSSLPLGLHLSGGQGKHVIIEEIDKTSLSNFCGLEVDDVIEEINGKKIINMKINEINKIIYNNNENNKNNNEKKFTFLIKRNFKNSSELSSSKDQNKRKSNISASSEPAQPSSSSSSSHPHPPPLHPQQRKLSQGSCSFKESKFSKEEKNKKSFGGSCRSFLNRVFRSRSHDHQKKMKEKEEIPRRSSSVSGNSQANISYASKTSSWRSNPFTVCSRGNEKKKKKKLPKIDLAVSSPNNYSQNKTISTFHSPLHSPISTSSVVKTTEEQPINLNVINNQSPSGSSSSSPRAIVGVSPTLKILNITYDREEGEGQEKKNDCTLLNYTQSSTTSANKSQISSSSSFEKSSFFQNQASSNFSTSSHVNSIKSSSTPTNTQINISTTEMKSKREVEGEREDSSSSPNLPKPTQITAPQLRDFEYFKNDQIYSLPKKSKSQTKTTENKINEINNLENKKINKIVEKIEVPYAKKDLEIPKNKTIQKINIDFSETKNVSPSKLSTIPSREPVTSSDSSYSSHSFPFSSSSSKEISFSEATFSSSSHFSSSSSTFSSTFSSSKLTTSSKSSTTSSSWVSTTINQLISYTPTLSITSHAPINTTKSITVESKISDEFLSKEVPVAPKRTTKLSNISPPTLDRVSIITTKTTTIISPSHAKNYYVTKETKQLPKENLSKEEIKKIEKKLNVEETNKELDKMLDEALLQLNSDVSKRDSYFQYSVLQNNKNTANLSEKIDNQQTNKEDNKKKIFKTEVENIVTSCQPPPVPNNQTLSSSKSSKPQGIQKNESLIIYSRTQDSIPQTTISDQYILSPDSGVAFISPSEEQKEKQFYDFISNQEFINEKKLINVVNPTSVGEVELRDGSGKEERKFFKEFHDIQQQNSGEDFYYDNLKLDQNNKNNQQTTYYQQSIINNQQTKNQQQQKQQFTPYQQFNQHQQNQHFNQHQQNLNQPQQHQQNLNQQQQLQQNLNQQQQLQQNLNQPQQFQQNLNQPQQFQQNLDQQQQSQAINSNQIQNNSSYNHYDMIGKTAFIQSPPQTPKHKTDPDFSQDGIYEQIPAHKILNEDQDQILLQPIHLHYRNQQQVNEAFMNRQKTLEKLQQQLNQQQQQHQQTNLQQQQKEYYQKFEQSNSPQQYFSNSQQSFSNSFKQNNNLLQDYSSKNEMRIKKMNISPKKMEEERFEEFKEALFDNIGPAKSSYSSSTHHTFQPITLEEIGLHQSGAAMKGLEREVANKHRSFSYQNYQEERKVEEEDLEQLNHERNMQKLMELERQKKYLKDLHETHHKRNLLYNAPSKPLKVETLYENIEAPPRRRTQRHRGKARVLHNFRAQKPREISLRKGDLVYLLRRVDDNWFEGEHHSQIGIFPVSYVEVLESIEEIQNKVRMKEGSATVLYDFHPRSKLELPLRRGYIVTLVRKIDDNWYEGRFGEKHGIFPSAYVSPLREPDTPLPTPIMSRINTPVPGWQSPTAASVFSYCPEVPSAPLSPTNVSVDFSRESTPFGGSMIGGPTIGGDYSYRSPSVISEPVGNMDPRSPQIPQLTQPLYAPSIDEEYLEIFVPRKPPLNRATIAGFTKLQPLQKAATCSATLDRTKKPNFRNPDFFQQPSTINRMSLERNSRMKNTDIFLHQDTGNHYSSMTYSSLGKKVSPPSYNQVLRDPSLFFPQPSRRVQTLPDQDINVKVKPLKDLRYKALHDFKAKNNEELDLERGEVVRVLEKCRDGWFIGYLESTRKLGIFPGNFVEPLPIRR